MGTDIHGIFQKRLPDGTWQDVPSKYDFDRHYLLFAWLGNVRNGFGFAGIKTHDPLVPLTDGRGLPPDFTILRDKYGDNDHPVAQIEVTPEHHQRYLKEYGPDEESAWNRYWMGDHSHSWVLGTEVVEGAIKLPRLMKTGVVDRAWYDAWDGVTPPTNYCGGISGRDVVVKDMTQNLGNATHVQIRWFQGVAQELAYFVDEVKRLMAEHGEVRFVFGFDS